MVGDTVMWWFVIDHGPGASLGGVSVLLVSPGAHFRYSDFLPLTKNMHERLNVNSTFSVGVVITGLMFLFVPHASSPGVTCSDSWYRLPESPGGSRH